MISSHGGWSGPNTGIPFGSYSTMFPSLRRRPGANVAETVAETAPGGVMDGGRNDATLEGPTPSGWGPFGQFLTHDLTFDTSPVPSTMIQPESLSNSRTPRLDLDNIYGQGPGGDLLLYDKGTKRLFFTLGPDGLDLPRMPDTTVIAPDPRDDNNLLLSQMHLAWCRFHNAVMDGLLSGTMATALGDDLYAAPREEPFEGQSIRSMGALLVKDSYYNSAFAQARRLVAWHWQWIVLHEYLPLICDPKIVSEIATEGPKHFKATGRPFLPTEFTGGAFRFAHSTTRERYRVNDRFEAPIFVPDADNPDGDRIDLRGGHVAPEHVVDWSFFFDLDPNRPAQRDRRMSTTFPSALLHMPVRGIPGARPGALSKPMSSLALRDLCRGETQGVPAGQDVAEAMDVEPLPETVIAAGAPLLMYVLAEAEHLHEGRHMGPVGSRIVAETLIGVLDADPWSFRNRQSGWSPTLGSGDEFGMADVLRLAGMV